ncbi:MAG: prenyltransferase/squalene oxidase repeat-containing protein [Chthoniobacteraceae bacterium]
MSDRLRAALRTATDALLAEMNAAGHWTGELSSSALSTATAIVALGAVDREKHAVLIRGGEQWLRENQNTDGGWGDTTRSKSNISTTALCWAALGGGDDRATAWLAKASGGDSLTSAIAARYGKDRTFSVPILMHLAICGRIDWREVMALPFELAALPHQLFGALQLPVVSYALPALIAIGQAIHHHAPSRNPLARIVRVAAKARTLDVLARIQPDNGGFLEATPLTSFVTMALASTGLRDHRVIRKGVTFLVNSARPDGSWPIDTNLATWVTTLAIKALPADALKPEQKLTLREWLLGQQYSVEHPYTHAAPGGWAWTDLPGGVPDADDTPGALLALLRLGLVDSEKQHAAEAGVCWLLGVQNRDGGIPTFCRGWGALPFDRSSPDLTAHTLRAWSAWLPHLSEQTKVRVERAITRALAFLGKAQRTDGSWLPLWFGNEHAPDDINPIYGTTHVVVALRELDERGFFTRLLLDRATDFLATAQNDDGGWGGARGIFSTTEETALAVEALAGTRHVGATDRGVAWLVERVESGAWRAPAPIGFYFAKLWYHERLYPLIWTVGALRSVCR